MMAFPEESRETKWDMEVTSMERAVDEVMVWS
jgi:hypothetical protein